MRFLGRSFPNTLDRVSRSGGVAALCGVAAVGIVLAAEVSAQVRRIADLSADESLRIHYVSRGTYHYHDRRVTISGGARRHALVDAPSRDTVGWPTDFGGLVPLGSPEVRGLDALLDFYRSRDRREDCVIVEVVTLTWMKKGAPIAVERFRDASCEGAEQPGVLTLRQLIHRAR